MNKDNRRYKKFIQKMSTKKIKIFIFDYKATRKRSKNYKVIKYIQPNYIDIDNRHGCCIVLDIGNNKNIALINLGFKMDGCTHSKLLYDFYNDETKEKATTTVYEKKDVKLFKRDSYLTESRASYAHLLLRRNYKNGRINVILLFEGDWSEHNYDEIKSAIDWWNTPQDNTKSVFDFKLFAVKHSHKSKYSKIYPLQKI